MGVRWPGWGCASRAGGCDLAEQLTLTARLNTSAVDSRRGVVRLHPSAVAALGIREWDAVSLTGSRTTAAVAGLAAQEIPVGVVLLDDVTLSNAGLREGTPVLVSAVTVYGARSVTLSGSGMAMRSLSPVTLRQALLGKVMTVGDAVSLLPRDLGPGTSTSAATRALASSVGISWTSELLTVTGVDPDGPVSVQPNTLVTWGTGVPYRAAAAPAAVSDPDIEVEELKGAQPQATKLTEWLKLALDEPHLLKTLGAGTNLGVLVSGPAGVGKVTLVRAVCSGRRVVDLDGPEVGALAAEDRLKAVAAAVTAVRDGGGVLLITDVDALLPADPEPVASL
ncbi:AAA family ATPase, partial [Mycobacterium sp. 1423905.2]|uniref:AAA family ATPase n=1 Tax=Mycobacterium sp. 1423905.2 TaxID=1856859 RepID=UPI00352B0E9B